MLSPSTKREIIHFHVKVMQCAVAAKRWTQNQDAGANLLLNVLFFFYPATDTFQPLMSFCKSHNRTERNSQGVGQDPVLDILIFRIVRTTRKQFPVN